MNCEEVRRRMLDRALEELPAEEFHPIEEHIRGCAACAQAWEEMLATYGLLSRHLVQVEVPRQFRLVAGEAPATSWWPTVWLSALRFGLSAGLALVLLVASLALFGASLTQENGHYRLAFGRERVTTPAAGLSRVEIDAIVATHLDAAERRLAAQQSQELARLFSELKVTNAREISGLGERVRLLQSAQNQMWKESQQSQYLMRLVASNALTRTGEAPK